MNSNLETFVPFDYKCRGVQRLAQAATPAHDTKFLVGLGRAFYWQSLLDTGAMASGSAIARAEGLDAVAPEHALLAVERQMILVLGYQHMGQQTCTGI